MSSDTWQGNSRRRLASRLDELAERFGEEERLAELAVFLTLAAGGAFFFAPCCLEAFARALRDLAAADLLFCAPITVAYGRH